MTLEFSGPPHPHHHHRPRRRIYGTFPSGPVYYYPDTRVIEIETQAAPALPWRVISTSSWGTTIEFQTGSMAEALKFFKNKFLKSAGTATKPGVGFNVELSLQHWTGSGWKTEARRNSQDWLSAKTARGRAGYG